MLALRTSTGPVPPAVWSKWPTTSVLAAATGTTGAGIGLAGIVAGAGSGAGAVFATIVCVMRAGAAGMVWYGDTAEPDATCVGAGADGAIAVAWYDDTAEAIGSIGRPVGAGGVASVA